MTANLYASTQKSTKSGTKTHNTLTDESFFRYTAPSHALDPHKQHSQPPLHLPPNPSARGCDELSYTADQSDTVVRKYQRELVNQNIFNKFCSFIEHTNNIKITLPLQQSTAYKSDIPS